MKQTINKSNSPYERDFYKWALTQVDLLKKKEFSKLDIEHIIEEIEGLSRSDKRSLKNYLTVLLQHLLKTTYVPEQKGNSNSWQATIFNCRRGIKSLLKDSPSLKNELNKNFEECYEAAREMATLETNSLEDKFPIACPWSLKEVMGE